MSSCCCCWGSNEAREDDQVRFMIGMCIAIPVALGLFAWLTLTFGYITFATVGLLMLLVLGPYLVTRAIYTLPMKQTMLLEYELEGVPVSGEIVDVFRDETSSRTTSKRNRDSIWKIIKYTCPEDKCIYQRRVPADENEYRWQLPTRPAQAMRFMRGYPRSGFPFDLIEVERVNLGTAGPGGNRTICIHLAIGIPLTFSCTIVLVPWLLTDLWFRHFHEYAFVAIVCFGLIAAYSLASLEFSTWRREMLWGAKNMGMARPGEGRKQLPTNLMPSSVEMEGINRKSNNHRHNRYKDDEEEDDEEDGGGSPRRSTMAALVRKSRKYDRDRTHNTWTEAHSINDDNNSVQLVV